MNLPHLTGKIRTIAYAYCAIETALLIVCMISLNTGKTISAYVTGMTTVIVQILFVMWAWASVKRMQHLNDVRVWKRESVHLAVCQGLS